MAARGIAAMHDNALRCQLLRQIAETPAISLIQQHDLPGVAGARQARRGNAAYPRAQHRHPLSG